MKTTKWIVAILIVCAVSNSFAASLPKLNVTSVEGEKALVSFETGIPSFLEITVRNDDGEIMYYKKTENQQNEFRTIFDFSYVESGKYDVCVLYGKSSISREMRVSKHGIEVGDAEQLFEPYFKFENDKLDISFLNSLNKNVHLCIYSDGKYVAGTKLGKELAIQKRIDLSKLEAGDYKVVLNDTNNYYSYNVHK